MTDFDAHPQDTSAPHGDPQAATTSAPRKRGRLLKLFAFLGVGLLVFILAIPSLLSWTLLGSTTSDTLTDALGTPVKVESASVGWFSGLSVKGLEVANPEGFGGGAPCVKLAGLEGDISITSLLSGKVDLRGRVDGLHVRAIQRKDGSLNLEKLGSSGKVEKEKPKDVKSDSDEPADLSNVRLDLQLTDAIIEIINEELGTIEHIRDLDAVVKKEFGGSDIDLELGADLGAKDKPTRLDLTVDVDANFDRPADIVLQCKRLDLARYKPLLVARMPDQIDEFAGIADGNLTAQAHPEREIVLGGELTVTEPRLSGALFQGMKIRAPKWVFRPEIKADVSGENPVVDTSKLSIDLGFASASGLEPTRAKELIGGTGTGLGAKFDFDLSKLISFGGFLPEGIATKALKLDGEIALPAPEGKIEFDVDQLLGTLGLQAKLSADEIGYADRLLQGLSISTSLGGGKLVVQTGDGSKLDGGMLNFLAKADITKLEQEPVEFEIKVNGANLGGSAVKGLQFAVPILAGIAPEAATAGIDFQSAADLTLKVKGPAMPTGDQTTLEWLNGWSGLGDLALRNSSFTPAQSLASLMQLAGQDGKLEFNTITTAFGLEAGEIQTKALKLASKGKEYGLTGKTTLAGDIDYSLDLSSFLEGHKDAEKILKYLPKDKLNAKLVGSLVSPSLAMPDLNSLMQGALKSALESEAAKALDPLKKKAEDELKKGLNNALKGLIPKGDKKKLEDEAKKGLNNALNGLFGGNKKKKK